MDLRGFEETIWKFFGQDKLKLVEDKGEFGFTNRGRDKIRRLGFCTNLTVETANQCVEKNIDLLFTHHDAWEWMSGMKEDCMNILNSNGISHYYIHLPLDDADFGNNVALLEKLGFKVIEKFSNEDGMYCGRIGILENDMEFDKLILSIEGLLGEKVRWWKNNNRRVNRVGIVTGAGFSAKDIKEAYDLGCDTYITGEKILYTVEYARYKKINLIVGSHTFTEIFGVQRLCEMIKEKFSDIEVVEICEEHLE